ncbi:hypothetical protein AHF37_09630 [Paragonimus kellicotti]|nr:hypothetical protein AHF37_09630 [Paragonimus kellicotti]
MLFYTVNLHGGQAYVLSPQIAQSQAETSVPSTVTDEQTTDNEDLMSAKINMVSLQKIKDGKEPIDRPDLKSYYRYISSCCNREVMRPQGGGHFTGPCCSQLLELNDLIYLARSFIDKY